MSFPNNVQLRINKDIMRSKRSNKAVKFIFVLRGTWDAMKTISLDLVLS